MALSDIVARLQLVTTPFNNALNAASRQVHRFSSEIARASVAGAGTADRMIAGYTSLNDRLRKVGLSLRDIARITGGIMISQAFYSAVRSIREATSALWEFNQTLDYAQVTYSALFNSTSLASNFLNTLKDFSVDTIYEYSDLEGMARKLLAYGIEYKNLMYIIEGLTNIGTLSGDTAALERLAVAIGQINAKGYLQAEEIRQLTNAYAPMYDILQTKFGLSRDQLGSIGDLKLPAHDVINAIVEYANERFGDVANAAMYTITGLNNRIVDSFKVLGADILQPFTTFYKSFAFFIAEQLDGLRTAYNEGGLGGIFEKLVPSEVWQQRIRTLLSSIQQIALSISALFHTLAPYASEIFGGLINGISPLLSIISAVIRGFTTVFQTLASNTPIITYLTKALMIAATAWAVFRLQALASAAVAGVKAAIVGVANAVLFLAKAILANPILTMILLIGGALVGFAASSNKANNAFSSLVDSFNSFASGGAGSSSDEILQAGNAMGGATTNSDQFWESMEEGASSAEDAVNKAGGAAKKAAKGLLSFDEVFKLNQNSGGGSGSGIKTPDFSSLGDALGGLGGGGGLLPDIPDFSEYAKNFAQSLYGDLWDAIKAIASGAATGGIIGALVGFAIGGLVTKSMSGALGGAKIGAKIGTIAGAGFAGFWTDTYKQMEASLLKIAGGAAAGTLIGGLIGMVIGAFATRTLDGALYAARYGAAIGGFIGAGIGSFWSLATDTMKNAIQGLIVGTGAGGLAGALVGFILGAFITKSFPKAIAWAMIGTKYGTMIGAGLGTIFGTFSEELQNKIKSIAVAAAGGALIGGLAGFMLGAFITRTLSGAMAGAKLGTAIGTALGVALDPAFASAEAALSDKLANLGSSVSAASTGALIGGLAGMLIGAIVGAFAGGIGALPGAKAGAMLGAAIGGLGPLVVEQLNNSGVLESIGQWFVGIGASIGSWFTGIGKSITDWWNNLWIVKNWNKGWDTVAAWFETLWTSISTWFTDTVSAVANWWSSLWKAETWTTAWDSISTWFGNLLTSVSTWFIDLVKSVKTWWSNLWKTETWPSGWTTITTWFSNLWTSISGWFTSLVASVKTWWGGLWNTQSWASGWLSVTTWFSNLWTSISGWFTSLVTSVKTWWKTIWSVDNWVSGWTNISAWFSTLWSDISTWFANLATKVANWWNNLWKDKKANVHISSTGNVAGGGVGNRFGTTTATGSTGGAAHGALGGVTKIAAYASGGIVSREQIARIAEGNKREAVIPLDNETAMRPFADAVSNGIVQSLLPVMASASGNAGNNLPPMYVGALIADERGLQQLYKKFELYEAKEMARKGLT